MPLPPSPSLSKERIAQLCLLASGTHSSCGGMEFGMLPTWGMYLRQEIPVSGGFGGQHITPQKQTADSKQV